MSKTVIVFGPTGNIASVTATTAQGHGAKVFLAMRDPSKAIAGLSSEQERLGGYERVQADLEQPNTVTAAVEKSGAKHAFIYAAHGSKDHMKATLEALKSAGIEFIVFLSSFTIHMAPKDVPPEEIIPYIHARVEVNLEEIFGHGNYVAVRPGGFATNSLHWKQGFPSGDVKLYGANFKMDCITPVDMGRVCGTILAKGAQNDEYIVYLYGPKDLTQKEMAEVIGKELGKDIKISGMTADEATKQYLAAGIPKPVTDYMMKRLGDNSAEAAPRPYRKEGLENVKKYSGHEALGFAEWVAENKGLYTS